MKDAMLSLGQGEADSSAVRDFEMRGIRRYHKPGTRDVFVEEMGTNLNYHVDGYVFLTKINDIQRRSRDEKVIRFYELVKMNVFSCHEIIVDHDRLVGHRRRRGGYDPVGDSLAGAYEHGEMFDAVARPDALDAAAERAFSQEQEGNVFRVDR